MTFQQKLCFIRTLERSNFVSSAFLEQTFLILKLDVVQATEKQKKKSENQLQNCVTQPRTAHSLSLIFMYRYVYIYKDQTIFLTLFATELFIISYFVQSSFTFFLLYIFCSVQNILISYLQKKYYFQRRKCYKQIVSFKKTKSNILTTIRKYNYLYDK